MNQKIEWKKTQAGSSERVQFSDGMIVTAEDLNAAMTYPLSVVQVLLKAYFGCGIVCGLDLRNPAERPPAGGANGQPAPAEAADARPADCDPNFILTIEKGVALGCDGYPIEVCGPLKLDLTPDPCRLDRKSRPMFVAARRVTSAEAAARPCGCGPSGGEPAQQCSRMRDHVLVQAFEFERLPTNICSVALAPRADADADAAEPPAEPRAAAPTPTSLCDCLTQCGECACCGEAWVLLGSVMVGEEGLGKIDRRGRRLVKPIACACEAERKRASPAEPAAPVAGGNPAIGVTGGEVAAA